MILRISFIILFTLSCASPPPISSDDPAIQTIRMEDGYLKTPIYTLESPTSPHTITLIGMIHIADKSFYKMIHEKTKDHDSVFFEGIYDNQDQTGSLFNLLAFDDSSAYEIKSYYKELADALDLGIQSEELYPKKNWVHLDVSIQWIQNKAKNTQASGELLPRTGSYDLTRVLDWKDKNKNDPSTWEQRKIFREQIAKLIIYESNVHLNHNDFRLFREVFLYGRNEYLTNALERILKQKQESSRFAILYGSAHFPDLIPRLKEMGGFKVVREEWKPAWNLR